MKKLLLMTILGLSSITTSFAVPAINFEKSDYPNEWSFTVDEIAIWCMQGSQLYVVEFEKDQWYALNGSGKANASKNNAHADISPIWAKDPDTGANKSLSFWIDKGLKACK